MNKDLESIFKKIDVLNKIRLDGKEHQSLITKQEARALTDYIDSLKAQLNATEEVVIEWQKRYEKITNVENNDEIEFLFDLYESEV